MDHSLNMVALTPYLPLVFIPTHVRRLANKVGDLLYNVVMDISTENHWHPWPWSISTPLLESYQAQTKHDLYIPDGVPMAMHQQPCRLGGSSSPAILPSSVLELDQVEAYYITLHMMKHFILLLLDMHNPYRITRLCGRRWWP
jgi:hypothetical protein